MGVESEPGRSLVASEAVDSGQLGRDRAPGTGAVLAGGVRTLEDNCAPREAFTPATFLPAICCNDPGERGVGQTVRSFEGKLVDCC
jgi:hypothetical protein